MDHLIKLPVHRNDFFDGLNSTEKLYLKAQMELLGKLASNDT